MIYPFAAVTVLALSTLTAQSVGVSLTALAPLTIQASDGVANASNTWPAGPMGPSGSLCAALPTLAAGGGCLSWYSWTQNYAASVTLGHSLGNQQLQPNFSC